MNLKQLYIFGMENSQEPVIKNPVLRAALEGPQPMAQEPRNMYSQGQLVQNTVDGSRPGYKGEEFSLEKNLSKVPPKIRDRFIKVNNYLKEIIPELNASEKYVTKEQVSSMVEEKFNIKPKYKTTMPSASGDFPSSKKKYVSKVSQFETKSYPVLKNLDSVETKIENTLKNMLLEKKPLNDFWYKALSERTGLDKRTLALRIEDSPTYKVIKDQGAGSLKNRFNKLESHSFLKELSFSDQLTTALEMEQGMPRYTGMGKEKYFTSSPKFKVMKFAIRNFHRNKGNGVIKFFDKNGKKIKWSYGVELPYKEVSFTYNGKKYNANKLSAIDILKKDFPEVYKNQTALNNLKIQKIDDPLNKGKKISIEDLVKRNQVNAYKWPHISTFDILHGPQGVAGEPFTNLSFNTRDINQLEMGINQSKTLSQTQKNNAIRIINEAAGSGDPKAIIKRQIDLATDFKAGNIKSYEDMKNVMYNEAKLLQKLGFGKNCKASGGRVGFANAGDVGAGQIKCIMSDVEKTRADMKSPNVEVRAKALTKQRKGLQLAQKIPALAKMLRRGIQGTLGAVGLTGPIGWAVEGLIEGGIYDYYRRKGYDHNQAFAETFTPRLAYEGFQGKSTEDVPWYGGSEKLREQELIGDVQQNPKVAHYVDALKEQDRIYETIGKKEAAKTQNELAKSGLGGGYGGIPLADLDAASEDVQDLARSGAYRRVDQTLRPESMASQAYNTAVESQQALDQRRRREYLEKVEPGFLEREQESFDTKRHQEKRYQEMDEMFPEYSKEDIDYILLNMYGTSMEKLKGKGYTYKNIGKWFKDKDKSSYFADNFRMEKATGGIASLNVKK